MQCTFSLKFPRSFNQLFCIQNEYSCWRLCLSFNNKSSTVRYSCRGDGRAKNLCGSQLNWWLFLFSFLYFLNIVGPGPLPPLASATSVTFCLTNKRKNTSAAQVYDKKRPGLVSNFCTKSKGRCVEVYGPGLSDPEGPGGTAFDRSVNPISSRVEENALHITTGPSGFLDLPMALWSKRRKLT